MYTMRTQRERLWIKYDIEKIGVREFRSELPEDDIVREFRQMCEADRANQRKDLDK